LKTLIIAEAGVNHNGDIKLAKRLIDVAAEAGSDLVKFQTFKASDIATTDVKKAEYQMSENQDSISQYEMLKKLELSEEMHHELISHCKKNGIGFLSTGFDLDSVKLLKKLGQDIFKVPSGEITNLPLLRLIGGFNCEVILSTGMSDMSEIGKALEILQKSGTELRDVTVLQCTSAYPTPASDVNLSAMVAIRDKFKTKVGYSDHTLGIEMPIAAVALGASIIEKHFTLDKDFEGPDHRMSLNPRELKEMVSAIRNVEIALGNGIKEVMQSEIKNMRLARKSVVAKTSINKGDKFSNENITCKRAGKGMSPMNWDEIIGKISSRNYKENEPLFENELEESSKESGKEN